MGASCDLRIKATDQLEEKKTTKETAPWTTKSRVWGRIRYFKYSKGGEYLFKLVCVSVCSCRRATNAQVFAGQNKNRIMSFPSVTNPQTSPRFQLQGEALFTLSDADWIQASEENVQRKSQCHFLLLAVGTEGVIKQTAGMTTSNKTMTSSSSSSFFVLLPMESNYHLLSPSFASRKAAKGLSRITLPLHQSASTCYLNVFFWGTEALKGDFRAENGGEEWRAGRLHLSLEKHGALLKLSTQEK